MESSHQNPSRYISRPFEAMEESEAAGYRLWFREEDVEIVNSGMNAAAVRPSAKFGNDKSTHKPNLVSRLPTKAPESKP